MSLLAAVRDHPSHHVRFYTAVACGVPLLGVITLVAIGRSLSAIFYLSNTHPAPSAFPGDAEPGLATTRSIRSRRRGEKSSNPADGSGRER